MTRPSDTMDARQGRIHNQILTLLDPMYRIEINKYKIEINKCRINIINTELELLERRKVYFVYELIRRKVFKSGRLST